MRKPSCWVVTRSASRLAPEMSVLTVSMAPERRCGTSAAVSASSSAMKRVYQQVIGMGDGGLETFEKSSDARLRRAFALLPAGGLATNWQPAKKMPPSPVRGKSWKARKLRSCRTFFEAAEGTRTLDLLHGKQTL